jgi:hypothetical protein
MSNQAFAVTVAAQILAQPATEKLIVRSDNAADAGNVSMTGLVSAVSTTETDALLGKREVLTTDLFASLTQIKLSAAQTGTIKIYRPGTAASGDLRIDSNPANNDTLLIGLVGFLQTYTFKTTLSGTQATQTVGASGTPANNDTVTVNGRVYTYKTTLTGAANEVHINGQDGSLTNLQSAINASGGVAGTDYGTGTTANADVTAGAVSSHAITLTAKVYGSAGNSLTLAKSGANLSVGGASFSGGGSSVANEVKIGATASATATNLNEAINAESNAGIDYSQGTAANAFVSATVLTAVVTLTDRIAVARQLAWSLSQGTGSTISIRTLIGGATGDLLAAIAAGTTQIFNSISLSSEDLLTTTLPGLVLPTSDWINVGGKPCVLRFKCADVSSALSLKYQTSTDGVNASDGALGSFDLDNYSVLSPLFVIPSEQNVEYIRLVFSSNTNTADAALDARVIY